MGRPRAEYAGLTPAQWLKGYLSGGSRSANEIFEVGELRGFSKATINRAKAQVGTIVSTVKTHKVEVDGTTGFRRVWYWRDSEIPEARPASGTKLDLLLHKVEELERKTEAPRDVTEDGPISLAPVDPSEVDADGYLKNRPVLPNGEFHPVMVTSMDVLRELKRVMNLPHEQILSHILKFALPHSELTESIIVQMLRANHIRVEKRAKAESYF